MEISEDAIKILLPAALGGGIALLSQFLSFRLWIQREKRRIRWEREIDRLLEIEEIAGELTEELCNPEPFEVREAMIKKKSNQLGSRIGRLRRHPEVALAARRMHDSLDLIISKKKAYNSTIEQNDSVADMEEYYRELLEACDRALGSI